MMTIIKLVNTSIISHSCLVGSMKTFKINLLSNFQVCKSALLTIVTILHMGIPVICSSSHNYKFVYSPFPSPFPFYSLVLGVGLFGFCRKGRSYCACLSQSDIFYLVQYPQGTSMLLQLAGFSFFFFSFFLVVHLKLI